MSAESGCAPTSTMAGTYSLTTLVPPTSISPRAALRCSGSSLYSSATASKFSWNRTDRPEHDGPIEHLGVPGFVQLFRRQVEHSIDVSHFELRDHPTVEFEFRLRIFTRPGIMRHPPARDNGYSFAPSTDDFR